MTTENKDFNIAPCDSPVDLNDRRSFKKLELTSGQKMRIGAFVQQLPSVMAADALADVYVAKFPNGVPHVLSELNGGGYFNMIRNADGKFKEVVPLYSMSDSAALYQAFNVMSIASGQYFLSQINNELGKLNQSIDKILEFLYGEKKAELMAEIGFAKYANQNFVSIMAHEQQRVSTIIGLQEGKKIAMKDIEFYMDDLESTVTSKDHSDIVTAVDKSFQIEDSLELAMQLYISNTLLEVYYAQNNDPDYILSLEKDISQYLDKCDKRMLGCFSVLKGRISDFKGNPLKKFDKSAYEERVNSFIAQLNSGEESEIRKSLHEALTAARNASMYYITKDGALYLKTA